jgi:hypothetical protein
VEEGASAYVYWAAVWPGEDCLITMDNPWKRAAWKHPAGFRLNDRYWAIKHYSYLTAPGYRRVGVASGDPGLRASAYLAPGGDWLVVVALNTSGAETKTLRLDLEGFDAAVAAGEPEPARAYRTVFAAPSQKGEPSERFRDLGGLAADGRVALPPRSLVTIAVHGRASAAAAAAAVVTR